VELDALAQLEGPLVLVNRPTGGEGCFDLLNGAVADQAVEDQLFGGGRRRTASVGRVHVDNLGAQRDDQ